MKYSSIKKFICSALILLFTAQSVFAAQNYTVITSTNENYTASEPIGTFSSYSTNGAGYPSYTTNYNYGYSQPISVSTPVQYNTPVYSGEIAYSTNPYYNQNYSTQTIETPQQYNKTVTTSQQYIDTREKADKVIDRGAKVLGTLAVVGAVTGLLIKVLR
ncbi:MAG: hypothetical protein NC191_03020 [Muribaculaceae bacterium]|nr:hypothetical protein [Muribaculaceae bacterium]